MAKQNYRQMKKQKENARKTRQNEKQQRRQTRLGAAAPEEGGSVEADSASGRDDAGAENSAPKN